jgi:hypothetical protein
MKIFYVSTLVVGFCLAVLMQAVPYAIPKDAFVASVLSRSPDGWTISLDNALQARLSNHDIKQELTTALQRRASFTGQLYAQNFRLGLVLIVLSTFGLARESKIGRMRKMIKQSTAPNGGPATRFDCSGASEGPPSVN